MQTEPKFVDRVEMAIMQFVILNKAKQGEVTKENLQQTFRGNLQMKSDHLEHCLETLVEEEHLRQNGNKYTITDDGREDVQQLQTMILEVPQIVGATGGAPRARENSPAMPAQGAYGGGMPSAPQNVGDVPKGGSPSPPNKPNRP